MIQSGVDEAGKGPVLGPMVIGLVSGDPLEFKNMGVKDSKALSHQSRLKLFQMIKDSSEYVDWIIIKSTELNEKMKESTLNVIEEQKVSELILNSPCTEVIVDSFDVNEERLSNLLSGITGKKIICRHRADSSFPAVSAASIVAKVIREEEMRKIREKYGNTGSGYPSDPVTIKFLSDSIKSGTDISEIVRNRWKTYTSLVSSLRQGHFS